MMMIPNLHLALTILLASLTSSLAYDLVRDYSGEHFFDRWDFYGSWDNLTLGNETWVTEQDAYTQRLAYINDAGNVIMRVDNTTNVLPGQMRSSVRITSQDYYDIGSLWIIDVLKLPFGCSVWPAFWTKGALWPFDGEIDIIEYINLMTNNQMALHTDPGCFHALVNGSETGANQDLDCSVPAGCVTTETKGNSSMGGFGAAGGGVWATQFDVSGIYIWFWNRANVPASITASTATSSITDLSAWGPPSASYPSTNCSTNLYFSPQQLVIDIALCGDWAGIPGLYDSQCGSFGKTGICYNDSVVGPGSPTYDNAYFEISHIRAYTTGEPMPTSTSGTSTSASTPTVVVKSGASFSYEISFYAVAWTFFTAVLGIYT